MDLRNALLGKKRRQCLVKVALLPKWFIGPRTSETCPWEAWRMSLRWIGTHEDFSSKVKTLWWVMKCERLWRKVRDMCWLWAVTSEGRSPSYNGLDGPWHPRPKLLWPLHTMMLDLGMSLILNYFLHFSKTCFTLIWLVSLTTRFHLFECGTAYRYRWCVFEYPHICPESIT